MAYHKTQARRLEVSRLDDHFKELRSCDEILRNSPANGWVNTIRKALGISAVQLARRLGVTRAALYQLEERERARSVTLKQLDKTAAAMDCELFYVLMPRDSLENSIRARAREKAEARLRSANISMGKLVKRPRNWNPVRVNSRSSEAKLK